MSLGERVLLSLCRDPGAGDYQAGGDRTTVTNALNLLRRVYPNLNELVSGKRVVDFGCGDGRQSIALANQCNCTLVGIDTNKKVLEKAVANAREHNIPPDKLTFVDRISPPMINTFDVVISQNSFEHFSKPEKVINDMDDLLKDSGILLLTFGPPWLAPYGSHMGFFCKAPWINLIFPERTVMKVRGRYRDDGAKRYEEVPAGLNKMTVARFESIVFSHQLNIKKKKYECVKGINWFSKLPLLRELLINHVSVVLSKNTRQPAPD